jgi:hypothetical protein
VPEFHEEVNAHITALIEITQRHADELLARIGDGFEPPTWSELGELAIDYAAAIRTMEGYRALLRRSEVPVAPVVRVK